MFSLERLQSDLAMAERLRTQIDKPKFDSKDSEGISTSIDASGMMPTVTGTLAMQEGSSRGQRNEVGEGLV